MSDPIIKERDRRLSIAVFEGVRKDNKKPYKQVVIQTGIPPRGDSTKWTNQKITVFSDQLTSLISLLSKVQAQINKA
jgi:hypothetical protein